MGETSNQRLYVEAARLSDMKTESEQTEALQLMFLLIKSSDAMVNAHAATVCE